MPNGHRSERVAIKATNQISDQPICKRTRFAIKNKPTAWSRLPSELWIRCWNFLDRPGNASSFGSLRLVCCRWNGLYENTYTTTTESLHLALRKTGLYDVELVRGWQTDSYRVVVEKSDQLLLSMDRLPSFLARLVIFSPHWYRGGRLELELCGENAQANDAVLQILSECNLRPGTVNVFGELTGTAKLNAVIRHFHSIGNLKTLQLRANMMGDCAIDDILLPGLNHLSIKPSHGGYTVSLEAFKDHIRLDKFQSIVLKNAENINLAWIRGAVQHWKQMAMAESGEQAATVIDYWYPTVSWVFSLPVVDKGCLEKLMDSVDAALIFRGCPHAFEALWQMRVGKKCRMLLGLHLPSLYRDDDWMYIGERL